MIYAIETVGSDTRDYAKSFDAAHQHLIGNGYTCTQQFNEAENLAGLYIQKDHPLFGTTEKRIVSIKTID